MRYLLHIPTTPHLLLAIISSCCYELGTQEFGCDYELRACHSHTPFQASDRHRLDGPQAAVKQKQVRQLDSTTCYVEVGGWWPFCVGKTSSTPKARTKEKKNFEPLTRTGKRCKMQQGPLGPKSDF
ncbi:hypothetical protein HDV63DRAFT_154891 [Trichoderma sp. SZMC 28014]